MGEINQKLTQTMTSLG